MSPDTWLGNVALVGFALASTLELAGFPRRGRPEIFGKSAFAFFALATLAASAALYMRFAAGGSVSELAGLLLTSAIGWLAVGGQLQFGVRLIIAFVAPLATLILLVKFFVVPSPDVSSGNTQEALSPLVTTHVMLAILGQAFAIIACAISIVYLWQQNLLKKKLLAQLPRNLPAIDKLARYLGISLWLGFVLITLGLVTGAIITQLAGVGGRIMLEYKVLWAILVWCWYLAILLARNAFNWPSKRIAQMSLGGCLLLAFTYFGMFFNSAAGS